MKETQSALSIIILSLSSWSNLARDNIYCKLLVCIKVSSKYVPGKPPVEGVQEEY